MDWPFPGEVERFFIVGVMMLGNELHVFQARTVVEFYEADTGFGIPFRPHPASQPHFFADVIPFVAKELFNAQIIFHYVLPLMWFKKTF